MSAAEIALFGILTVMDGEHVWVTRIFSVERSGFAIYFVALHRGFLLFRQATSPSPPVSPPSKARPCAGRSQPAIQSRDR